MKRQLKKRKTRDTILILTNGKKTEKNYFKSITNYYDTMFKVEIKFINKQCDGLVEEASEVDISLYNQIWCVFDIDDTFTDGHLLKALKLAKQFNINIAYSNESFEVWLLYHLIASVDKNLDRKTYIKKINKILQSKDLNTIYEKNNIEIIKIYFLPHILKAVESAKRNHQKHIAEHQTLYKGQTNYPIWDWKSDTTVYQLIDILNLKLKEKV